LPSPRMIQSEAGAEPIRIPTADDNRHEQLADGEIQGRQVAALLPHGGQVLSVTLRAHEAYWKTRRAVSLRAFTEPQPYPAASSSAPLV
jgi:hypothetical protein